MARILIVEHNEAVARYLKTALKTGNTVAVADNFINTWEATSRGNFDILMIDAAMPELKGVAVVQKALQENLLLHVIFIKGLSGAVMNKQATGPYAEVAITDPPFHLREIMACVRYLTGQSDLPLKATRTGLNNNIVHLDTTRKKRQQQLSMS